MIEKNRQIVVFGNFECITFENISRISNLKDKYSLVLVANEDFQPPLINPNQQFVISTNPPLLRPAFISNDRNFTVFFGAKRIHIEEKDADTKSYESFFEKAKEFIFEIIKSYSVSATRAAVNGTIFETNQSFVKSTYARFFKENKLISSDMDDWGFRINSKSMTQNGKSINRIISAQLRTEIIDSMPKNALYLSYDYNTVPNQTFENEDELFSFFNDGKAFRSVVINNGYNIN